MQNVKYSGECLDFAVTEDKTRHDTESKCNPENTDVQMFKIYLKSGP